ncbi:XRE family transcriptional regulator [Clostridium ljungdahlii]|uniref:Anaerobic benzoate catabolism transcriptional regulator n=1 Tax=Clostridium ljungdahlii TaxID=1538 RepID=A0A168LD63_9CLOT|nr:XRE family transcriptional regulator [Clostridium ljungdahlii]OAA82999.1 anaerobic benzoate catabolism transcriptional regulator [Clostridium ljungdahlii]
MNRVGQKIKLARTELGISQKQLAKKLGVSEGFINEAESGKRIVNQNIIDKLSKILGKSINDITMSFEEEVYKEDKTPKSSPIAKKEKVQDVWSEAFGSVLKKVPVYKYDMRTAVGFRQLPLIDNKIEGYAQDKVMYLQVESDDMEGFRIQRGDLVFVHSTGEIYNNSIYLVEYNGKRELRQIKKLDSNKVLLISSRSGIRTETIEIKSLKIIAKLDRLEIKL